MKKLRFNTRILLVLFVLFFTISCEKDQLETVRHNDHAAGVKSDQITCEFVTNLIAGQHYDVGDVKVINDGINIYVTYEILEPGWGIKQTHLHIADEFQAIPMTKK
ncbi:MAG TPA: hypothetical protein VK994_04040, partial [Bacteroidales bacterium]|nr:hypothetical protein [Bacteroidales bacterium]